MKILFFTQYWKPDDMGAGVNRIDDIITELTKRGHVCIVACLKPRGKFIETAYAIKRYISFTKPDVLYITSPPSVLACMVSLITKTPKVFDIRDPWKFSLLAKGSKWKAKLADFIEWLTIRNSDQIVVTTSTMNNLYLPSEKVPHIIYNGCNLNMEKGISKRITKGMIVFHGNMGYAQGLYLFPPSSHYTLKKNYNIIFVAKKDKEYYSLPGRLIPDMSRYQVLKEYVSKCEFGLVTLAENEYLDYALPSKIMDFIMFGKPVIAICKKNSELWRFVEDNHIGIALQWGTFIDRDIHTAVEKLRKNRKSYVRNCNELKRTMTTFFMARRFELAFKLAVKR